MSKRTVELELATPGVDARGQPGTYTSTGTIVSIPCTIA